MKQTERQKKTIEEATRVGFSITNSDECGIWMKRGRLVLDVRSDGSWSYRINKNRDMPAICVGPDHSLVELLLGE